MRKQRFIRGPTAGVAERGGGWDRGPAVRALKALHMTQHGFISCQTPSLGKHTECPTCLSGDPHVQVPALGPNANISKEPQVVGPVGREGSVW